MKRTFVFTLALVVSLTLFFAADYTSCTFAAEKDAEAEKAVLVKNLKKLPDDIKKEVADVVSPLDKAGPLVGIGIRFGPSRVADGKQVPVVVEVIKGKPAEKVGMLKGDKILAVNGKPFTTADAFIAEIRGDGKAGRVVTFEVDRNGTKMTMAAATAVLRSDKTAEAKKMREVVEKESVAHVAAVKNATDAIVKGLEDGSLSVKVFDGTNSTNPLLQAYDKVMTDYDSWAVSKSKEIDKLLAVE